MRDRSKRVDFSKRVDLFAWPCVLSDRPPVLWWLSPGEGWDAVNYMMHLG